MPINHGPNAKINTTMVDVNDPANIVEAAKCCCGKSCKGLKGLKMHQRRCRILEGLSEDQLGSENSNFDAKSSLDDNHEVNHVDSTFVDYGATVQTKPGVCLPKTDDQWTMANDFFKSIFVNIDFDSEIIDVNAVVKLMNDSIYNYFNEKYRKVKTHVSKELVLKYSEYSVGSLKKALKRLKITAAPLMEVRYVARLLRSKLGFKSDYSNNTSSIPKSIIINTYLEIFRAL